jgi:prefoldin alpha subunit
MSNEEELNKYMALIEQYKEQLNQLEMQFQYIQAAIQDYTKAKMTIGKLSDEKKDSEIIMPIGGSTYINAKAEDPSKVLFDIGSGYVIEKKSDDAIKKIEKRIDNLEKSAEKVQNYIKHVQSEANECAVQAQKLYQQQNG